ncbi:MAG: superoxide dismutase [Candidatus Doudnabacteria bacterium]|jgi:Fe-Mn family superoxide dismutase
MKYTLPQLSYGYGDLEPYIDAKTMEIHHTKHHQAYIDKLNGVLEKYPALAEKPLEELLKNIKTLAVEDKDRTLIQNHGGGHWNHSFFWNIMAPTKAVDQKLITDITATFGSMEEFKKKFNDSALSRFGSGWAWLVRKNDGSLDVYSTGNQDCPLMLGDVPLIGLDVWEHAYYLKYQNKRAEYINEWWNVVKII